MKGETMLRLARTALIGIVAVGYTLALATVAVAADRPPTAAQIHSGATIAGVPRSGSALRPLADGTFNILNANAVGKCIGISNGLAGDWDCTSNPDQTWHWGQSIFRDWLELRNGNNQCLAVNGASTGANARILGYPCVGSPDQYWKLFVNLDNGSAQLVNFNGWRDRHGEGKVIGVAGGSKENGAPLVLWWPDGSPNQDWF
jgi:hypothetical protein